MKTKLAFFNKGSEVVRYHTVHTLQRETVGHHSHGVAMLCAFIDPVASSSLLRAALLHDLAEHVTGDIPSPAKRLYGIGDQVSRTEEDLLWGADLEIPYLSDYEKRTLKIADIAQGALFCAREIQLGNREMRTVLNRYISYAQEFDLQEREQKLFDAILGMVL